MKKTLTLDCARAHSYNIVKAERGGIAAVVAQGTINEMLEKYYALGYRLAVDTDAQYIKQLASNGHVQTED